MLLQVVLQLKDRIEILQVVQQVQQDVSNVIILIPLVVVLDRMVVLLTLRWRHLVQRILVPLTGICIQNHHRILLLPLVFI